MGLDVNHGQSSRISNLNMRKLQFCGKMYFWLDFAHIKKVVKIDLKVKTESHQAV